MNAVDLALAAADKRAPAVWAIVPCYRVKSQLERVLRTMPGLVQRIIVVDDACPEHSGDVAEALGDPRVTVIQRERNGDVGAAMKTGLQRALEEDADTSSRLAAASTPTTAGQDRHRGGDGLRNLRRAQIDLRP